MLGEFSPRGSVGARAKQAVTRVLWVGWAGTCVAGGSPGWGHTLRDVCPTRQELERLEVERVEMIRQHLCQYTQLRHETDMFNQSVSRLPWAEDPCGGGAVGGPGPEESHLALGAGRCLGPGAPSWDGLVDLPWTSS